MKNKNCTVDFRNFLSFVKSFPMLMVLQTLQSICMVYVLTSIPYPTVPRRWYNNNVRRVRIGTVNEWIVFLETDITHNQQRQQPNDTFHDLLISLNKQVFCVCVIELVQTTQTIFRFFGLPLLFQVLFTYQFAYICKARCGLWAASLLHRYAHYRLGYTIHRSNKRKHFQFSVWSLPLPAFLPPVRPSIIHPVTLKAHCLARNTTNTTKLSPLHFLSF